MDIKTSELARQTIGAAIEVHRQIGPGLMEGAYQACLQKELTLQDIPFRSEVYLPGMYKGDRVNCDYRVDFVIDGTLLVEVKAVERLLPVHTAQALTYLRITGAPQALLINFNVPVLRDGVRSLLNRDFPHVDVQS